ncbi:MAG: hypothetical protein IID33_04575 [Planctomycetes bacterium]|nr:hypothetical protein [Planctomycetota bacterium]
MPSTKSLSRNSRTTGGTWNNPTSGSTTTAPRSSAASPTYSPNKYKSVNKNLQQWIGSFRNIRTQFSGAGPVSAFSPTGVNKWIKYVNTGSFVYKFTNADFCKKFSSALNSNSNPTTTAAQRHLTKKFGAGIKGITRGKGGCWLIAATPNVSGGPFSSYKW